MKKLIRIISFFVLMANMAYAQNTLKAKVEFEAAEAAYAANKYQQAIEKLNKAEELIGKWAPNIAYLKIQALDKVCDYEDLKSPYRIPLAKEIKSYMAFANANQDAIVFDKFKEVLQIEKRWHYASEIDSLKKTAEYLAGNAAMEKKEYAAAMDYFSQAAAKNNAAAMFYIGIRHYFGSGKLTKNYPEAMSWFKKAAEMDHAGALYFLGNMYSHGYGVNKDCAEAISWYQKAIDNGSTPAFNGIGFIYRFGGDCVDGNPLEAISWYKKGVEKGNVTSMNNIATMYEEGKGVPQSYGEAFSWYTKAAEKDDYTAVMKLSEFYEKGLGVTKDIDLALKWLDKAIEINKR
jgi:TPR repeat protein